MKILFGSTIQDAETLAALPEKAAETLPCLAVPVSLIFTEKTVTPACARYLADGGQILATMAVDAELAENIFTQSRVVKIAFVREFRSLCRELARTGIRELSVPFDVTILWRQPTLFSGFRALLCELSGPLLENHLVCRLPLKFPQQLPASRLAEFYSMLVPGAFGWWLNGVPGEEAADWSEPLRFYADCWSFPAAYGQEACAGFLKRAARCAGSSCRVYFTAGPATAETDQEI